MFSCFSSNLPKQVSSRDQSGKATQDFKCRSDEVMKKLVDWLAEHQTAENPLKFSQFEFDMSI
jgi:hypothetical protein